MTNPSGNTAALMVQIGSPASADAQDVKNYQRAFLSDPFVVSPRPLFWGWILEHLILPKRSARTALLYREMLGKSDSGEMPHFCNTRILAQRTGCSHCFLYGGHPAPKEALMELRERGFERIIAFPLHPQRGGATVGAALAAVSEAAAELGMERSVELFGAGFAGEDFYIGAQARLIEKARSEAAEKPSDIVFSFHGYPKKRAASENYLRDCETAASLICKHLSFDFKSHIAFQSKFKANGKWLAPSTEETVKALAKKGAAVMVACPGFVSDNLETVIEIDKDLRKAYEDCGGMSWSRVPCLNLDEFWIEGLKGFIAKL